jgi:hypothetical protein
MHPEPQTKKPIAVDGLHHFWWLGRNRTTDTRIFNLHACIWCLRAYWPKISELDDSFLA